MVEGSVKKGRLDTIVVDLKTEDEILFLRRQTFRY
jgi:hypothetical protein